MKLSWKHRLALVGVACVASLGVADAFFERFFLVPLVPDTEERFHEEISSQWPRPIPVQKENSTFRILGLADSFGEAGGHNNFHYLLEKSVVVPSGQRVEVVNLSLGGLQLPEELELLRRFGRRYQPDLVLHSFFVGNDFYVAKGSQWGWKGILVVKPKLSDKWRLERLPLLRWFLDAGQVFQDRRFKKEEMRAGRPTGEISEKLFLELKRSNLELFRQTPRTQADQAAAIEMIEQIREEARRMGAGYLLVIHPDEIQVDPSLRAQLGRAFSLDPAGYDWDLPQRFLERACLLRGIAWVDLLAQLRLAQGPVYYFRDTHYNEAGNALAAQAIGRALRWS